MTAIPPNLPADTEKAREDWLRRHPWDTEDRALHHAQAAAKISVRAPDRTLTLRDGKALGQEWAAFVAPDETPVWLGHPDSSSGVSINLLVGAAGAGLAGIMLLWQGADRLWPYLLLSGFAYAAYAVWQIKRALDDYRQAPLQTYLLTNRAVHVAKRLDALVQITRSLCLTPATQIDQQGRALHLTNPDQPDSPLILHSLAHPRAVCAMIQDIQKAQA
jgi:hypothetical protein